MNHLIIAETLKYIHKPIYETLPLAITSLFTTPSDRSDLAQTLQIPRMKIPPNTEYLSKSVIYHSLHLYRLLPLSITILNPKKFSKQIQEHLRLNWDPQNIPY